MIKKTLRVVLLAVLVVAFALPLSLGAAADPADPVSGFQIVPKYQSAWDSATAKIQNASYATWVSTDGQYNGCLQWAGERGSSPDWNGKVTLGTIGDEKGVLTFKEVDGGKLYSQIKPGDLSEGAIDNGAVVMSLDIFYEAGKTADGVNNKFCGLSLKYYRKDNYYVLGVTPAGQTLIAANSSSTEILTDCNTFGNLIEGWNTIIMIYVPVYDTDGTTVLSQNVYYQLSNAENPVADTQGYTQADLDNMQHANIRIDREIKRLSLADGGTMSLQPAVSSKGAFSIKDFSIANLVSDAFLYKVTYAEYPELTTYSVKDSPDSVIVPSVEGVNFWKRTYDVDGETKIDFYQPGDTMRVLGNWTLEKATTDDEAVANLGVAISKVNVNNLTQYSYAEMNTALTQLNAALDATADQTGTKLEEYRDTAEFCVGELEDQMATIAVSCNRLMRAAETFIDETLPLADRIDAYNTVAGKTYDITYSAACELAYNQMMSFKAIVDSVEDAWETYQAALIELETATPSAMGGIVSRAISAVKEISMVVNTFAADDIVGTKYLEYLATQKTEYMTKTTVEAKYAFLKALAASYNEYVNEIAIPKSGARKITPPQAMIDMINDYNEAVAAANAEILDAMSIAAALEYTLVLNDTMQTMLTDIYSKVGALTGSEN